MPDSGSVSISAILYRRVAYVCKETGEAVRVCVARALEAELERLGVPAEDPGSPRVKRRISSTPSQGRRRSVHLPGLLHRRARIAADALELPLGILAERAVRVMLGIDDDEAREEVGPEAIPEIVRMTWTERPDAPRPPREAIPEIVRMTWTERPDAPRPPRTQSEIERSESCARALAEAGLEPGGVQFI